MQKNMYKDADRDTSLNKLRYFKFDAGIYSRVKKKRHDKVE